ncbi:MAG: geranylgeranyl pyrophosphate synthase [Hyphomicrobiales bacterium]|nr:MAG: geranylgeranyl pyrophosphate synthase [Hyphomicrobiales bacterium]
MVDATFEARLAETAASVEQRLDALLGATPLDGERTRPARLLDAMRYASLGGGKRLRPFLVIETARLLGHTGEGAERAASALELVHCYSLVHDDLPDMDDDDMRRGQPTVHRKYDPATAILAGDALLTYAFDVLADPATDADAGVRAELVLTLARTSGLGGMAGGQMLDLAAENRSLSEAEIAELQAMKTGALIKASVAFGAILARADASLRRDLDRYATAIGLAFQLADDLLDVESHADAVGKATGKDAERGKATLVGLLGLEASRRKLRDLVAEAEAALSRFGPEASVLRTAARFIAERQA